MPAIQTGRGLALLLCAALLSGCAVTREPADLYSRNVVFTVPLATSNDLSSSGNRLASSYTGTATADDEAPVQNIIQAVLRFHGLHKVSQFSIRTLDVEAVVAEVGPGRNLDDVVNALSKDDRVESVQTVKPFRLLTYNDPYYKLQSTVNSDRIDTIHELTTGKNVTVGIVDTGVDRWHPELINSIVYSRNLVAHDQDSFDLDEHGTAVAGVIASAANNDLGIVGVAPDVRLMIFKACHQEQPSRRTACDSVSIIKALNDVLVQQPDILNLSLAGPADPIIERLLRTAYLRGIVLVAAVDESGNASTFFPASMDEVIAVGTSLRGGGNYTDMVLAPGTDMLTTAPGATYGFKSGSSMATAYVSGIVALMKERNPALSAADVHAHLLASERSSDNSAPVVDMCLAVNKASAITPITAVCGQVPSIAARGEPVTSRLSAGN